MKVSRKWLQTYFDEELPTAAELAQLITFHAFEVEGLEKVGDDDIIDVDVLPNRSSDCLSHRGIARELSVILKQPMKRDPLRVTLNAWQEPKHLHVVVDDDHLCGRYISAEVRGVTVGPSPDWLKEALEAIGQRSINNIVDATNYVMQDLGQPLHAFDLAKLATDKATGDRTIRVRAAHENEAITTLTGETYMLTPEHLLIVDDVTDEPLALAGIKGGKQAEVTSNTVDLVLESAYFEPVSVRKTSRALKLATDASLRFQNDPSPELAIFAMHALLQLIADIAGGSLMGVRDVYRGGAEREPVRVTREQVNALLGTSLTHENIEDILMRFEWEFSRAGETYTITAPWERTDLTVKEAMIEEIGRIYGYANIASVLPSVPKTPPTINQRYYYIERIRLFLAKRGYSEVYTYILRDRGQVELKNPLAADKAFMRMDLRDGLAQALTLNASSAPLLGLDNIMLFEVGPVFTVQGEHLALALGARAVRGKQKRLDDSLMKDLTELEERLGCKLEGTLADGVVEVVLDPMFVILPEVVSYGEPLPWDPDTRYKPWSPYPYVLRDIAVWVPKDTPAEEVLAVIIHEAPETLIRHDQFDEFEKDGRISYAWHLVFQAPDRTLTDADVTLVMQQVETALQKNEDWVVR